MENEPGDPLGMPGRTRAVPGMARIARAVGTARPALAGMARSFFFFFEI